jgi:uncharacterized protein
VPELRAGPHAQAGLPAYVAGLLRRDAFDHAADDLVVRDTHISWVILAGNHVYKLRKPVNLGFVDFSTLQLRAADCEAEVRLNRRLCPDVYLGVVQVVESNGAYHIGGRGTAVEPAVHMRRLPADGMLPRLVARGEAAPPLFGRIARRLARFHAAAATGPGVDEFGSLATVRSNWDENFRQTQSFVGHTLLTERRDGIRGFVDQFLADHADLFDRRVADGRVRDGHGDLHLDSICVEGRRLHLFDCIEFAPRFRCADVAAEVAFLAMDLDHNGRADLATAFVDAYVRASQDAEVRQLLGFYSCYRAYVRAKVTGLRLAEPGLTSDQAAETAEKARAYFDLAWAYAGGLSQPALVVVMGPPASGKTTVAAGLAARLGLVHLSSDVVRKELAGLAPDERSRDAFGQGLYAPAMTRRTYAALTRRAGRWLRRGRGVVLDATYGSPAERDAVCRLADRTGARLTVLVCDADDGAIQRRLAARATDAHGASDARLDLWPSLRSAFSPPTEITQAQTVSTAGSPDHAVAHAVALLTPA